ncbi:unnamed protein product, partial [Prorocentrum cordatum]
MDTQPSMRQAPAIPCGQRHSGAQGSRSVAGAPAVDAGGPSDPQPSVEMVQLRQLVDSIQADMQRALATVQSSVTNRISNLLTSINSSFGVLNRQMETRLVGVEQIASEHTDRIAALDKQMAGFGRELLDANIKRDEWKFDEEQPSSLRYQIRFNGTKAYAERKVSQAIGNPK